MAYYQLIQTQNIPASLQEIWAFISNPSNLKDITPPYMKFTVTSKNNMEKMYAGMIITYKVTPLLGIPLNWMTEITHVKENVYFVDEQRMGPYKMWHHQHILEEIESGVCMTDIVTYVPPFGIFGVIANKLFIRKQLNNIFKFRRAFLINKFGIL